MNSQDMDHLLEQSLSGDPPGQAFRARVLLDSTEAFVHARQYRTRWRSVGRSEVMEIEIRPGQTAAVSKVTISDSGEVKEGSPSAKWSASGRRITIQHSRDTYQGYINSEGNLILGIANEPVTFQKVE